jgi:hypothetical protein
MIKVEVLRWMVELGRINIIVPVSLLSRYLVSPHEDYPQKVFDVCAYRKQVNHAGNVFDHTLPNISYAHMIEQVHMKVPASISAGSFCVNHRLC